MLQPHQQRVVDEHTELRIKLVALSEFLENDKPTYINDEEWKRLNKQKHIMMDYVDVLKERIDNF